MSWWTNFRDTLQTVGGLIANYFYPGTIMLGKIFNSKESQRQLYETDWGRALGVIGGLAGGFAGGAGGSVASSGSSLGGTAASAGALAEGAGAAGGVFNAAGTAASTLDPEVVNTAWTMISNGGDPVQVLQSVGMTPAQAQSAGIPAPAGQTWGDVAAASGGSYYGDTSMSALNPTGGGNSMGGGAAAANNFNASGTAKATGAMPWGSPGNVTTMAQGAMGLYGANQMMQSAEQARRQADPFEQYRERYARRMEGLMADPSSIEREPGYQAGQQAIKRTMASQGYTGSGNMMRAMSRYGGDFFNQTMNMYGGLAGAGINPGTGAQLGMQGRAMGLQAAWNSMDRLGYGVGMAQGWGQDPNQQRQQRQQPYMY